MSDEFEGNFPDINIVNIDNSFVFNYRCVLTEQMLCQSCANRPPWRSNCFNCIGFNKKFDKYYKDNMRCSCGTKLDFGYFMLIFQLEKAGLLTKDFKIQCCYCFDKFDK